MCNYLKYINTKYALFQIGFDTYNTTLKEKEKPAIIWEKGERRIKEKIER